MLGLGPGAGPPREGGKPLILLAKGTGARVVLASGNSFRKNVPVAADPCPCPGACVGAPGRLGNISL